MAESPISALIHLVQGTAKELRYTNKYIATDGELLSDALEKFAKERLIPIFTHEKKALETPYILSLVGLTNVGKSTLTEALLGYPVAPRKSGPATAIPVEYVYGDNWKIEIQFNDFRRENLSFANDKLLGAELIKRVVEVDANTTTSVAWVTVHGPMKMLSDGLILADTPGFGAAQINGENSHQKRLEDFINSKVHRLYFCVAAGEEWVISDIEKDFYSKVAHICSHVIVNKWIGEQSEEEKFKQMFKSIFPNAEFIFVNAKKAINGQKETASEAKVKLIKDSNLLAFQQIIESNSSPEKRIKMCYPELIRAWEDFHAYTIRKYSTSKINWSKVLLENFKISCSKSNLLRTITEKL